MRTKHACSMPNADRRRWRRGVFVCDCGWASIPTHTVGGEIPRTYYGWRRLEGVKVK